jgi:peptidyl-prolyl cis-trans isomerase C
MSVLKYLLIFTLLAGISGLSLAADANKVVATVNGKKITEGQLDQYMKFRQATTRQDISHDKKAVLEEMINRQLLMDLVWKKHIDKKADLKYLLEQQTINFYIQALLHDTAVAKPVPESEVKKVYDEKVKNRKLKEYKVSHILLKSKKAAEAVIAKLNHGADFAKLAKKESTGPSAKEGGELGWLNSGQLHNMPNFAKALAKLKKGSYTKTPVKTNYGWHVVKLEDERNVKPPSLQEVHNQIVAALRRERMAKYVESLRNAAKIDIKLK